MQYIKLVWIYNAKDTLMTMISVSKTEAHPSVDINPLIFPSAYRDTMSP